MCCIFQLFFFHFFSFFPLKDLIFLFIGNQDIVPNGSKLFFLFFSIIFTKDLNISFHCQLGYLPNGNKLFFPFNFLFPILKGFKLFFFFFNIVVNQDTVPNGNIDLPVPEGVSGADVERRLNRVVGSVYIFLFIQILIYGFQYWYQRSIALYKFLIGTSKDKWV